MSWKEIFRSYQEERRRSDEELTRRLKQEEQNLRTWEQESWRKMQSIAPRVKRVCQEYAKTQEEGKLLESRHSTGSYHQVVESEKWGRSSTVYSPPSITFKIWRGHGLGYTSVVIEPSGVHTQDGSWHKVPLDDFTEDWLAKALLNLPFE